MNSKFCLYQAKMACQLESLYMKEQHLQKIQRKTIKEETKSQNLHEISLFPQLVLRILLRSFSAKYSRNQPKHILPLQ